MNFDLELFAKKLKEEMELLEYSAEELQSKCRIPVTRINAFLRAESIPVGDEILIISDVFRVDYIYFISNDVKSQFEKTYKFYRATEGIITRVDKRIIADTLYLAEFINDIIEHMGYRCREFIPKYTSQNHVEQGKQVAEQLRELFNLKFNQTEINPFSIAREMGIQVFRRHLSKSIISGIHMDNENTGKIILINYDDDIYRQNFSLLHELAHCIFDSNKDYSISMMDDKSDENKKRSEWRANSFASQFLIPEKLAKYINGSWNNDSEFVDLANKFNVNPATLSYSLNKNKLITESESKLLSELKIRLIDKSEPELSGLSYNGIERVKQLQEKGFSFSFIKMSYEAYHNEIISFSKLCEMLFMSSAEVYELMKVIGWVI